MHQGLRSRIVLYHSFLNHATMQTMQLKFSTMLFWLFSMAGSTVTRAARDRPHLEDASITQLFKSTVRSGSLLGNKRYLPRPNSIDVRVGDKLKVVQFHPVIRNSVG